MKVISPIHIPLDLVPISLRRKRVESVRSRDLVPLRIRPLLVLLVVAVIGIDDIAELANLALHMKSLDLGILEVGVLELIPEAFHGVGFRLRRLFMARLKLLSLEQQHDIRMKEE